MPTDLALRQRRLNSGTPESDTSTVPGQTAQATDTGERLRAVTPAVMSPAMRRALREQLPSPGTIARERQGAQTMHYLSRGFMMLSGGFVTLAARATYRAANAAPAEQLKQSAFGMGALMASGAALAAAVALEDIANPRLDAVDIADALRSIADTVPIPGPPTTSATVAAPQDELAPTAAPASVVDAADR